MRKLKLQVQMSIDGFVAGPNGEMDWLVWNWDDGLKHYVEALTTPVDCIVLGRKLAEGFIPYWASVAADPANPQFEAGKKFTETKKVVFSNSLDQCIWDKTELAKSDLVTEIEQLKKQEGNDLIAYGGASFVSDLIEHSLVDEYHLFVNPTVLGKGMTIFDRVEDKVNLALVKATSFDCGIVVLHFEPKRG